MTNDSADKTGLYPAVTASRRYAVARKRTTALLRGLSLILAEHSAPDEVVRQLRSQVHRYLDIHLEEGLWVEHAKSLLTHPFSQYLNNEPPKVPPSGIFKPKDRLKRWLVVRQKSFSLKNTHFWYSWLQSKRCCLPASETTIEAAYRKHMSILTKEDDGDDLVIERILNNPTFRSHLDCVRDGITSSYSQSGTETTFRPSLRSSLTHTRGMGGAISCLRSAMEIYKPSNVGLMLEPTQLMGMSVQRIPRRINASCWITKLVVVETRTYDESLFIDWEESVKPSLVYEQAFDSTPLRCKITGIIEPLKVRVISRGPAKEYYLCKKLQKAMHGTMRQMPAYRLIGRPLKGGDTIDLRRPDGTEWFSIDYSAATDNLSYKYSRRIFDYIVADLPECVRLLGHKVLGLHTLEYPDGTEAQMCRGQLMGSILSFPVLCLANMGVYLDVTNEYQAGWNATDRTSSVFINGDDMLYAAPRSLWPIHTAVSNSVGLELSVGKAYVHPKYLNINSTSVHHSFGNTPVTVPYLNTGLFFGQSKVMKTLDEQSENSSSTTTNLNRLIEGSLPGRQHILLAKFLRYVGIDNLDKENRRFYYRRSFANERGYVLGNTSKRRHTFVKDLFLPIQLGGCGVVKPLRFRTKRGKKIQIRVANGCFQNLFCPSTLPLPTSEYIPEQDHHIPVFGLESCDSPSRDIYPYKSGNSVFGTPLEFRQTHHPMREICRTPSVPPPVRDFMSGF